MERRMVGADNAVSKTVKTAKCFPSEDSTVSLRILNLLFWNLIHSEKFAFLSCLSCD